MFFAPTAKKPKTMVIIEKCKCRELMIYNKQFLSDLYESNGMTARKILNLASDSQIKLWLCLLHFISKGEIPLSKDGFKSISKAKKGRFIHTNFDAKTKVKKLLKTDRKSQLEILLKLSSLYRHLLTRLFHLPSENVG